METEKKYVEGRTKYFSWCTGSALKIIAMLSMLVDHIAVIVVMGIVDAHRMEYSISPDSYETVISVYTIMRKVGRISFPLFIFLLVEGAVHTKSQWRYLGRMLLLALVSEIPFDIAFHIHERQVFAGKLIEWQHQNIFFTLSIGLFAIITMQYIEKQNLPEWVRHVANVIVIVIGVMLGDWMHVDYGGLGVLAIMTMYLFRRWRLLAAFVACMVLTPFDLSAVAAAFSLIPIAFYNGQRGWKMKWVFYFFYPLHLIVLWEMNLLLNVF